jgi:hypothetical protein
VSGRASTVLRCSELAGSHGAAAVGEELANPSRSGEEPAWSAPSP